MKRFVAVFLATAILGGSPGLECYQAWGAMRVSARFGSVRNAKLPAASGKASFVLLGVHSAHYGVPPRPASTGIPELFSPRRIEGSLPAGAANMFFDAAANSLSRRTRRAGNPHEEDLRTMLDGFYQNSRAGTGSDAGPVAGGFSAVSALSAASGDGELRKPSEVPSPAERPAGLGGETTERACRALKAWGWTILAGASLSLTGLSVPFVPLLTAAGLALLGAGKYLQVPVGAQGRDEAGRAAWIPDWLRGQLSTLLRMGEKAEASLSAHEIFESRVGGGSRKAFSTWLASSLRAGIYWLPMALLGMFGGALLGSPLKLVSGGLNVGQTAAGQWLIQQPWLQLLSNYLAKDSLVQVVLLGGVFQGVRALLGSSGVSRERASFAAAAAAAAVSITAMLSLGIAAPVALTLLGIQSVLIYTYARSGTLAIPLALNALMALMSLYSARLMAFLQAKDLGAAAVLPSIPGLGGVIAVLGLGAGLFTAMAAYTHWEKHGREFLKVAARRAVARLAMIGRWWKAPRTGAAPRSPWPVVSASALWGVGVYLSYYLTYWATQALLPGHEVVPDSLKKTVLMPLDQLAYVFSIGASLEEWIFRAGLFAAVHKWMGRTSAGPATRVWTAAILSSLAFSAVHFVDLAPLLAVLEKIGLAKASSMVYGFSWAGFMGRVGAGLMLAFLYFRSGIILLPIAAHFTSNLLEAVGLRWGLPWMLAAVVAIFAAQAAASKRSGRN